MDMNSRNKILVVVGVFTILVMSSASTCDLREEGLKQRLERCHEKSDLFLKQHVTYRNHHEILEEKEMCRSYFEYRNCIGPLIANCTNIKTLFMKEWSAIDEVMNCACLKKTKSCHVDLKCIRVQFHDPLVRRCDIMHKFQRRQRIYDECGLLREAVLCRDRLVRTACGEQPGEASFQLAKLSAVHPRHRLKCNVSSIDKYRGFTYSPMCSANFTHQMHQCYREHLRDKMILFREENDLIVFGDRSNLKRACRNYKKYMGCEGPIREHCSEGIDLLHDMLGRRRTYLMKMNYICDRKNEEYGLNLRCLQSTITNQTLQVCDDIWYKIRPYLDAISAYQFYCGRRANGTVPYTLHKGLKELRTCYTGAFSNFCGNVTGVIMDGLMKKVFHDPYYLKKKYKPRCNVNLRTVAPPRTKPTQKVAIATRTKNGNVAYATSSNDCHLQTYSSLLSLACISVIHLILSVR